MATLNLAPMDEQAAHRRADLPLLPITGDNGTSALASSTRFGTFVAGATVVVASTAAFHILAGGSTIAATTAAPRFAAGVYRFVVPDGCTHVAMIDTSAGAGNGQVYAG